MWSFPFSRRLSAIEVALAAIRSDVATIKAQQEKLMSAVTDLQASVAAEDTVIGSAITLLQGLSAALAAAGTDPAALAALKSDIDTNAQALAAAVTANTPASGATGSTGTTGGATGSTGTTGP